LCGYFDKVDGEWHSSIARFNTDGTVDRNFNSKVGGSIHGATLQLDGKILIAGDFGSVNGKPRKVVARLDADGRLDESFNAGNGTGRFGLARLNPDGRTDRSFQRPPLEDCRAIVLLPEGKILAAPRKGPVMRFNADGSTDSTFASGQQVDRRIDSLNVDSRGR